MLVSSNFYPFAPHTSLQISSPNRYGVPAISTFVQDGCERQPHFTHKPHSGY